MSTATLGSQSVGAIVKLRVNGESRNFIVVQQGCPSALYDSSCGGTWLLMQDIYCKRVFDAAYNELAQADLTAWLENDFIALLDSGIQSQLVEAKLPYAPSPLESVLSGSNGYPAKVFLLSQREVGQGSNTYSPEDGTRLSYFVSGSTALALSRRTAQYNGSAAAWWTRSPYMLNYSSVWVVEAGGESSKEAVSYETGVRPALILPADTLVSDDGSVASGTAPSAPGYITVPDTLASGGTVALSWAASSDADGDLTGYQLERSTDGGANYTQIYRGAAQAYTDTVDAAWTQVRYRVCAYDSYGTISVYTVSANYTVQANSAPTVSGTVENGGSLGNKSAAFGLQYTVADTDGDAVTAREYLDNTLKKSGEVALGAGCVFQISGSDLLPLANDAQHTLKVVANDGKADSEAYAVTFTKSAHTASVTLTSPLYASAPIRSLRLAVKGDLPSDALLSVLATNNAADASPVWEDVTQAVRTAQSYAFANETAAQGYALNFQISVSRGASDTGGYISAITGAYSSGAIASGGSSSGSGAATDGAYLDLFAVMGTTANQKLWNAVNAGGLYSGSNRTLTLCYSDCTPPGTGLGAPRYYIAYRDNYAAMDDSDAQTVIRDTVFRPEGDAPVLMQFLYKSGTLVFEHCTFRNVLFWFGETARHKFVFRNCVIEDNEYNFIHCGERNANAEYLIEGCTFRHMRPNKEEYRADIVPLKLNGWAHGNLRCLGYDVTWTIRDTTFEDCMGQLNIFFGKSSLVEADPGRVKLYMERCTVRKTNGAGISFQGQPVTGWIRDCNFAELGANRCNGEGYDLPTDASVHAGTGTEADPYVYACGVGGNAIFSYNDTPRHELVISGNHIAHAMENGIEGNYREVSFNHIEDTGCRLAEGLWTPSTEGIYGSICVCKGNVVRNPGGEKAGIIIPRGFTDGQAGFYEDNLVVYDAADGTYPGGGFEIVVDSETFGPALTLKNNTIRGFAKKYDLFNPQQADLTGLCIADCGEDDDVIKRADFYQNSLLGVHYEAAAERSVVRDAGFASFDDSGSLTEWSVLHGTGKVYITPSCERYVRVTGGSTQACALLAQDYRLGADIYLARVRCAVRSSSGKVGFAPLSVDNTGAIVAGQGELVFNPQMAVLEVPGGVWHEVTHTMAVTRNCRICILNPGYDAAADADALSQLDIRDVEVTLTRCQRGTASESDGTEAGAMYDFSAMTSVYSPASALKVSYYLPCEETARTGVWCDAAWMMGQYTGGSKGRGRVVLDGDATQYAALTVWYASAFDLELGGHTLTCANTDQYGFLQLFNGADVTIKGPGTIAAQNYALTLAAGCKCTVAGGAALSTAGDYAVFVGSGSADGRTEFVLQNGTVDSVLAEPFTQLQFALPNADAAVSVGRLQTSGSILVAEDTKAVNNGVSPAVEVTGVKQLTGLFACTDIVCTYAQGHTEAQLAAAGDESSATYSYLDANSRLVAGTGTLTQAFAAAAATYTARPGVMNIRLNSDAVTYAGFWAQDLGTVHLNLNSYKIATEHQSFALYFAANCDVTLYDSSDRGENTGLVYSTDYSAVIVSGSTARLHVNGGTVHQLTGNCIHAENSARVILSGEAQLTGQFGVDLSTSASLTVNGGAINATSVCVQAIPAEGSASSITVHGGTLTSDNITVYAKDVTFEAVEGTTAALQGTLSLTQAAVIGANTEVTVNGTQQTTVQNAEGLVLVAYDNGEAAE